MKRNLQHALFVLALSIGGPALAHEEPHQPDANQPQVGRVLGRLDFPTSTQSAEAQAAFVQGMLLLHLFEYPFAQAAFQRAQTLDPGFAMAYWGEAMVHNHPVWDQQDSAQARGVLNKFAASAAARAAKINSPKERDYFASLEILYGEGTKAERDRAYMNYLEKMSERYPEDPEVRLFYALAIMGAHAGVRDIPAYMESAAISQSLFYANREHPGAAHYLIHAVDDPIHAPLGLEAARALYVMAPDAGHSLHMTSHIFTALGMWDDVVVANTNAIRVANEMAKEHGRPATNLGHYNFWLLYALLQQGRTADAKALLTAAYAEAAADARPPTDSMILDPDNSRVGSMVQMWARYLLETGGADVEVAAWKFNTGAAFDPNLNYQYVLGMLSQDPVAIKTHLAAFRAVRAELYHHVMAPPRPTPSDLLYLARLDVIDLELQAALARGQGNMQAAIQHAREASRLEGAMPYSFGPPFVDYPSAQLLGEMLLAEGNFEAAAAAFVEQLTRSRGKTRVVEELELAQAHESLAARPTGQQGGVR